MWKRSTTRCSIRAGIGSSRRVWFLYNKNQIEYDEFKAFDLRLVLSGGLGHHLIKSERDDTDGPVRCGCVARVWRADR